MNEGRHLSSGTIIIGLLLVAIGGLFLLDNWQILEIHFSVENWWPVILIVIGLSQWIGSRSFFHFPGWFMVMLGVIFLCANHHWLGINWENFWKLWPLMLIFLGISVISSRPGSPTPLHHHRVQQSSDDFLRITAILSGTEKKVTSQAFSGGEISTIMGGAEVDLRGAKLAPAGGILTVGTVMGGVEIYVPTTWKIEVQSNAVFGGIDDRTRQMPVGDERLIIRASAVMGGIEIKN